MCYADGRIDIAATVTLKPGADNKPLPIIPKIGLQTVFANSFETVKWFGKGPCENYWDRQDAAWLVVTCCLSAIL